MNQTIFLFLNNIAHQNQYLDTFIFFCAEWLSYLIVSILFFYYAYKILREKQFKKYLKEFSIIFISTFIVWGVSQIINYFYYSPRPFLVLDNINVLFEHGNADSFPSGHATFFFSLAFISYFFVPRLLTAFLLDGAIIIALSRIIAGVHWPADIFGAIVLAGVGVYIIKKTILPKLEI